MAQAWTGTWGRRRPCRIGSKLRCRSDRCRADRRKGSCAGRGAPHELDHAGPGGVAVKPAVSLWKGRPGRRADTRPTSLRTSAITFAPSPIGAGGIALHVWESGLGRHDIDPSDRSVQSNREGGTAPVGRTGHGACGVVIRSSRRTQRCRGGCRPSTTPRGSF